MRRIFLMYFALLLLFNVLLGKISKNLASHNLSKSLQHRLIFFVTIKPQIGILKSILDGIDEVSIKSVVKKGESPKFFSPKPSLIKELFLANAYFLEGLLFENTLKEKLFSQQASVLLVKMYYGTKFSYMNGIKVFENHDPHIWLSPESLFSQLKVVYNFFTGKNLDKIILRNEATNKTPNNKSLEPKKLTLENNENLKQILEFFSHHKTKLKHNYQKSIERLKFNISHAKKVFSNLNLKTILVFHPAFNYYFKYFGIKVLSIEKGKRISLSMLNNLGKIVKQHKIKAIFIQDTQNKAFISNFAKKYNLKIVFLDSLPLDPISYVKKIAYIVFSAYK